VLTFTDAAIETLAELCHDPKYGARHLRRKIQEQVEDRIVDLMMVSADQVHSCIVGAKDGEIQLVQTKKA